PWRPCDGPWRRGATAGASSWRRSGSWNADRAGWATLDRTLARWYGPITAAADDREAGGSLGRLIRLADWALYAPEGSLPGPLWAEGEIRSTCRRVVRAWTLGRLRAAMLSQSRKVA